MTIAQRGDLRPGARRDPLRRRRRRGRASPTTPTTGCPARCGRPTRSAGVDVARRVRTGTYGVNGMGMDFALAVRRLQGVGHRPRARPRGPRGVPRAEDHRPAARLRTCLRPRARACGSTSPTSHPQACRALAADVYTPAATGDRPVVCCCVPGGGMSRGYFDLPPPAELGNYSMVRHLTRRGFVVVTIDPPGVGDSDVPDDGYELTVQLVADVYARASSGCSLAARRRDRRRRSGWGTPPGR